MDPFVAQLAGLVDRLGVSIGFLIVVTISIRQIGKWLAPRFDDGIRRHFAFLDGLLATQVKLQESIEEHRVELREWRATVDQRLGKMAGE